MPNTIKHSGEELALQITKPARAVTLVEENADGDSTRRAEVLVYAFDETLFVVNRDRVSIADHAGLVASAARATESIYRAADASIQIPGNGCQVNLPPAEDAGFDEGNPVPVHSGPGLLVISTDKLKASRLAADLVTIRRSQVST